MPEPKRCFRRLTISDSQGTGVGPAGLGGGRGAAGLGGTVTGGLAAGAGAPGEAELGAVADSCATGCWSLSGDTGGMLPLVSSGIVTPFPWGRTAKAAWKVA